VRSEEFYVNEKFPMTPAGIEPATFRFAAQHLNHCAIAVLCYKSEGRWYDPSWCHWNFSLTKFFLSHYGPGIDSAANRNEHQEYFLGVKAAGA